MTTTPPEGSTSAQTGHRPGRRPDEPRNFTVCFTVTEHEKTEIDALSHCIHLRRSAILTEIVTRFMSAAQGAQGKAERTSLLDFLEECQEQIQEKRSLFDTLTKEK